MMNMAKSFNELALKTMSKAARNRAEQRANDIMAELLLSELRESAGSTQKELANRLGISQPTLSRMEKQTDIQVTTLQRVVEALGGRLEVVATFPNRRVTIRQFGTTKIEHRRFGQKQRKRGASRVKATAERSRG